MSLAIEEGERCAGYCCCGCRSAGSDRRRAEGGAGRAPGEGRRFGVTESVGVDVAVCFGVAFGVSVAVSIDVAVAVAERVEVAVGVRVEVRVTERVGQPERLEGEGISCFRPLPLLRGCLLRRRLR